MGTADEKNLPYLYKNFDITAFMASPLCSDSVITRMRNALVEGLNNKKKSPKLILLVLDEDIIKITHLVGENPLMWLFSEVARAINSKKDMLPSRCITAGQPEIIGLKPIPIPARLDPREHHKEDKRAVHKIVDKIFRGSQTFDAMNITSILPTDLIYYEDSGDLTVRGHVAYWTYVNYAIQNKEENLNSKMFTNRRMKSFKNSSY